MEIKIEKINQNGINTEEGNKNKNTEKKLNLHSELKGTKYKRL